MAALFTGVQTQFSQEPLHYTGPELRPHFLLSRLGLRGSALVAFRGSCKVETGELVDWEDRLENDRIEAREMVHFLGEFFGETLAQGVLRQRLLMAQMAEVLNSLVQNPAHRIERRGDDLFALERKMSVSIVTASPVSVVLHAGINIDPKGAPVPAIGTQELGLDASIWVPKVLERFKEEWNSMDWACAKVRPVV